MVRLGCGLWGCPCAAKVVGQDRTMRSLEARLEEERSVLDGKVTYRRGELGPSDLVYFVCIPLHFLHCISCSPPLPHPLVAQKLFAIVPPWFQVTPLPIQDWGRATGRNLEVELARLRAEGAAQEVEAPPSDRSLRGATFPITDPPPPREIFQGCMTSRQGSLSDQKLTPSKLPRVLSDCNCHVKTSRGRDIKTLLRIPTLHMSSHVLITR